ncbi:MAG TPA: hypothetical protein VEP90_15805 [Methylomirabilota bacterium]|nr:hypothetical protein [Methylomirabilota bacterium]
MSLDDDDFDDEVFMLFVEAHDLQNEQKTEQALEVVEQIIQLDPTYKRVQFLKGYLLLALGRYEEGWPLFVNPPLVGYNEHGLPFTCDNIVTWFGEETNDLVTLYGDQGYGDFIQFARYIPQVKERCPNIRVVVRDESLVEITRTSFGVDCVPFSGPIGGNMCPITNLGWIFKTTIDTIPNKVPYLMINWSLEGNLKKASVGICWKSERPHPIRYRDIPDNVVEKLFTIPNSISLQKEDLNVSVFSETAAIINNLDLIITIDTAVAHLAGALGKPTWLLLSHDCCWRWMQNRTDSPWYPTMELIRQPPDEIWEETVDRVLARF